MSYESNNKNIIRRKELPLEAISSIEGLSQCNILVIKQNRETIQGISVKFEK